MRIGLIDVDKGLYQETDEGKKNRKGKHRVSVPWRNLYIMHRAAQLKAQGHDVVFPYVAGVSAPVDEVELSVVFTRSRPLVARQLKRITGKEWDVTDQLGVDLELPEWVRVGGTGWNIHRKAPPGVEDHKPDYTIYDPQFGPANYGQGFTSRGCPRGCHFCVVPEMSGSKVTPIHALADLRNGEHRFIKLMDDNILANKAHALSVFDEARRGGLELSLTQGGDIRFVDDELAEAMASVQDENGRLMFWDEGHKNRMITFAFDRPQIEKIYVRGFEAMMRAGQRVRTKQGKPTIMPGNIQSFVLTAFDTTVAEDMRRVEILRALGALPFVMVYEPIHGETVPEFYLRNPQALVEYGEHLPIGERYRRHYKRCKHLQRYCNFRAIFRACPDFEQYEQWVNQQRYWNEFDRGGKVSRWV